MKYCVRPAHDKKTLKILHVPHREERRGRNPCQREPDGTALLQDEILRERQGSGQGELWGH